MPLDPIVERRALKLRKISKDETLDIRLKARELLVNQSNRELELGVIVNLLLMRQESNRYKNARSMYDFFVSDYPNCLVLKLLRIYQCSSRSISRFGSIYLLSETLRDFRNRNVKLSLDSLHEIKPLLISCLKMKETKESDIKIFRRIVYFVTYNVIVLHNGEWDELGDCILWLAKREPLKAFHIFVDLPPVPKMLIKFLGRLLEEARNVLRCPTQFKVKDWSLSLQTFFKMWIQIADRSKNTELIRTVMMNQLSRVVNSVKKLVEMGNEQFLIGGLEDFQRFFSYEMHLYHYTEDQCRFVSALMLEIEGVVGSQIKEIVRRIKLLVREPWLHNPAEDELKSRREEFYRGWNDHLKNLSSLEVLKIFMNTDLEEMCREMAIRRLNILLSDHSLKKLKIDIAEIEKLQSMLIRCLKEVEMSETMFKVIAEVMNHVTDEMLLVYEDECSELRDYIASSTTEFQRAVYIFKCLTMRLTNESFINPVMENLVPQIMTRLDPPRELLLDNSDWVLAFTGGFCAAIHMVEDLGYANSVEMIAEKMISSVRELVERKMEVGLVMRAFRDVESIVKKQVDWYGMFQYKLLKVLLWRLCGIKGMTWESKIVLWRLNVIVERGVQKEEKDPPKNDFDWLHSSDQDVEFMCE